MSAPTVLRWSLESLGVAMAYCLTAYVVMHVQSGLGAPNLLWLPAGIALSACLLRGTALLPAIFIATLGFHFYSLFSDIGSPLQAWAAALITATGSTVQPWFTAALLRRWIRNLQVDRVTDAFIFILCAAIGCTIAASSGLLSLVSHNKIGADSLSLNWLTWWVGDLSGMLVVAPLVLVAGYWRRGRREWSLLSLPIIGLGCSFTLVSAFIIKHLDHDARVNDFMNNGVVMGQALQRTLDLSQRDQMSSHALFYNREVSRQEFHNFAETVLTQNRLIRSLTWAPLVKDAQRAQFEADARQQGWDNYSIRDRNSDGALVPAIRNKEYLPILLAEPEISSPSVFGFNLLSDPIRQDAIALSRYSAEPRASRLVNLIRGGKAVVIYWPVYRNEYLRESRVRDNDNLRGFVGMSLEVSRLAEETLRPFTHNDTETWLVDMTQADDPQLLYHHIQGQTQNLDNSNVPDIEKLRHGLYQETGHHFAGREWILISRPLALDQGLKANGQFIGILLGGFCLTFMLALYLIARQRSERILHERDERLMSQNAVLTQLARVGMTTEHDVNTQLAELIATSAVTLRVERVGLWMFDETRRKLYCRTLFTQSNSQFSSGLEINAEHAPIYFATLDEGRGFAADDAQNDARTREFADNYLRPLGVTSMMDVPVRIGRHATGVICHEHVGPKRTWAADEKNFAASIGDLASLIIESDMRRGAEKALQESFLALERKVDERTEQLRAANGRLRQLDQLKSMFIASMSHELRTPLNSIIGFTGVVLQGISGPLTEKQSDHLNRVYGSAKHLLALITDVIDISKIEAGYADVYVESFSLPQLVDEAIATIQPQRLEKGLELSFDHPDTLFISSDRKRLLQCVLNLLSNAVKYSEQGSIHIDMRTQGQGVVIAVSDQGIGIAPEALDKLFQPFERIDTHLRIKTPGTGLGLYLTRKIMSSLLQGEVSASSSVDKGSTFTLWIPLQLSPPTPDETPS